MAMRVLMCVMAFAVTLSGCASLGSHPPRATNLSGEWQLNESLSDDPMAVMREHMPKGGGMHRHGGMRGMGLTEPGGSQATHTPGHRGGWQGNGGGPRRANNEFLARPAKLVIQQGDRDLELIADGVPTDYEYGEKVVASVQGGAADRTNGWKGKTFVVKYDVKDGPKAARSYELNDGGRQLVVTTEVTGGRGGTMKLRAVYQREPSVKG
jgi:hypothetical protein